VNGGD